MSLKCFLLQHQSIVVGSKISVIKLKHLDVFQCSVNVELIVTNFFLELVLVGHEISILFDGLIDDLFELSVVLSNDVDVILEGLYFFGQLNNVLVET